MNNFGLVELASAKTTVAPGWAYVPDTSLQSSTGLQPKNRKRARNAPSGPSISDLTARQEARIRKEVEALEKDGNRDNTIPIPTKPGRKAQGKTGPVRKILQSQKTFGNYLDDFLALQQAESVAAAAAAASAAGRKSSTKNTTDVDTTMTDAGAPSTSSAAAVSATKHDSTSILLPPYNPTPASHPGDNDPLLISRVPEPPSDEEIRTLLAHPPLTYLEARGTWDDRGRPPPRVFCELCGYWGRVRCMKCGTRVCALNCLEMHREECVTRYGL